MSAEAKFLGPANQVEKTLSAAATSGDLLQADDGRMGVVQGLGDYASGETVTLAVAGRFKAAKKSADTWSAGATLYWDQTNEELTVTSTGNEVAGTALAAGGSGETEAKFDLNGQGASA